MQDDEYIPHGEDIEAFLKREIAKPIIRWEDSPQLGYEILPNSFLANLPGGWKFDRFKDVAMLSNERTDEASEVEDYLELEDIEPARGAF